MTMAMAMSAPCCTKSTASVSIGSSSATASFRQGLTLAHFRAQLEDLQDRSLTLELNLSTFRTHPEVNLGCMGDKV
jgi:hypothetical protein